MFRMGFLKISASDFTAWNLCGNRQNGDTTAMAIVETIDQMQVPRSAASGADCQIPGQMSFRSRRERGGFFVSHGNPLDVVSCADRVGNPVEGVSGQTVDPL